MIAQGTLRAREVDLILCCARTWSTPQAAARIRDLIAQDIDWQAFLALVGFHGVRPLVRQTLRENCWDSVPGEIRQDLDQFYLANSGKNRFLTGELLRLLQLFETAGIRVVPFKGPALAIALYGEVALREFVDLDLLVEGRDAVRAREILSCQGYGTDAVAVPIRVDTNTDEMYSSSTGIMVELHWDFSPRRFASFLTAEDVWKCTRETPMLGRQVGQFSGGDLFLFLTFHGAKHCWSNLKWVCDVAEFIRVNPDVDWRALLHRARSLGALRTCRLAIYLATDLLQAPMDKNVLREIQNDQYVRRLAQDVRVRLDECRELSPTEGQIFGLKLKERLRDKLRYVVLQGTQFSGEEARSLPLPAALSFLYVFIRPVWLLQRYGLSMWRQIGK